MVKTEFEFGERVLVAGEISRMKQPGNRRTWYRAEHPPRPAIFLNGINLANGTVDTEVYGYDEGCDLVFNPSEVIKGAWICEYNRAPRKVFLSDVYRTEEDK